MTRIAILSDIHGNLAALEAVIADMEAYQPDRVIVAGDIINTGPFSVQVIERIVSLRWSILRGNHEFYMLDYGTPREPDYRKTFTMPPWLNQIMPKYWRDYIAALPDTLTLYFQDSPPVRVAHATPGDHFRGISPATSDQDIAAMLAGVYEPLLVVGHTHLRLDRQVMSGARRWRVINPGACGLPLDNVPSHANYVILDGDWSGWRPTFRSVPYDSAPLYAEFERIDYLKHCGVVGALLIEEFRTAQVRVIPYYNWQKEQYPGRADSWDVVEAFLKLDTPTLRRYMSPVYRGVIEASEAANKG